MVPSPSDCHKPHSQEVRDNYLDVAFVVAVCDQVQQVVPIQRAGTIDNELSGMDVEGRRGQDPFAIPDSAHDARGHEVGIRPRRQRGR